MYIGKSFIFQVDSFVFCEGRRIEVGRIILSNSFGLQKYKETLSVKRSINLKYRNVIRQTGGLKGYNVNCYRGFTTLSMDYTKSDLVQTLKILPQSFNQIFYQSHQQVFGKKLVYFLRRKIRNIAAERHLGNVKTPNFENKILLHYRTARCLLKQDILTLQ